MATSSPDELLQSLLEEYGHVLRRAIHRFTPSGMESDVDDIEQEARLRIWRALQQKTELEQPASYLYRLAVNVTLNAVRKRRAQREQSLQASTIETSVPATEHFDAAAQSPEHRAERREILGAVRRAMASLPPNRQRAVGLHLQGFTTVEIGEICGWTEAKARNLAYRGLDSLRRRLKEKGDDLGSPTAT